MAEFARDYTEACEEAKERNDELQKEMAKSRQKFAKPKRGRRR